MFWLARLIRLARPMPPTPTAAMFSVSLGGGTPRPRTWLGTMAQAAPPAATLARNVRREISFLLLMSVFSRAGLSRVGEGDVGTEGDHAEARSDALAAAETRATFKFALERSGKDNDEKIGSGIEDHRESAKNHELQKDMAAVWGDELRNEGEEKKSRLGIENFGENALTKCARRGRLRGADGHLRIARADHANAEPNEIRGTRVFDGVKCNGGSSEDRGDAERGGQDMEESTNEGAEGRKDTFTAASGEAARQDVKDSRPWSDCQQERSGKEKQEMVDVEHPGIVRARLPARKMVASAGRLALVDQRQRWTVRVIMVVCVKQPEAPRTWTERFRWWLCCRPSP